MFKTLVVVSLAVMASTVNATSGGLDASGCHHDKRGGYHCHGVKLQSIKRNVEGETQGERMRRLNAQCAGLPNEGVCEGYAR